MSHRVIVMVSDLDDPKHGEISVHESPKSASKVVETLLESGFPQARIRVFSGDEMGMQVAHRPVVALMSGNDAETGVLVDHAEEEPLVASRTAARAEVTAAPFSQNGMRFSSAFRPA